MTGVLLRDTSGPSVFAGGRPFASVSTPVAPTAIRNVVVTPGDSKVTITWDDPLTGTVSAYNVKRSPHPGDATGWDTDKAAPLNEQTFLSLVNGHEYTLTITAFNDTGADATVVTATPVVANIGDPGGGTGEPGGGTGGSGPWTSNGIVASFQAPYYETSFFKRKIPTGVDAPTRWAAGMANLDTSDGPTGNGYDFKAPLENVTFFDIATEGAGQNVNLHGRASSFGSKCATKGAFQEVITLPVGWQNRYHLSSDGKNNQVNRVAENGDIRSWQASMACSASVYTAGNPVFNNTSIFSDGQQGARGAARHGNGGLVRPRDMTEAKIEHMLELVGCQKYLYGTKNGGSGEPGFQWPALAADAGYDNPSSGGYYLGSVPQMRMGSIVALPENYDLDANGITGFARKVGVALIEYGAIICDITSWQNNNSAWALSVDSLVHQQVWLGEGWSTNPVQAQWLKMIKALQVVDVTGHPEKP